ncbi:AAA family ATPase [Nocardioides zeae]
MLEHGVARVFPAPGDEEQRAAARHALTRRTTVLTGGPGTGKTTAVAGLLALLAEQAEQDPAGRAPRVALAAPTGKAAARLTEAVAASARRFSATDQERVSRLVRGAPATTLHRLLGARPDSSVRFRHHRGNRLPHDVVVVDEASMLSLTMTARLLEAVRPEARLLLVGDPDQLASVEAGAVLADLVAGFGERDDGPVVRLRTSHRFGASIGALAAALRDADEGADADTDADTDAGAESVLGLLRDVRREPGAALDPAAPVAFVELPEPAAESALDEALRPLVLPTARAVRAAALAGDGARALELLGAHRLLCAHRSGPAGVAAQNRRVEAWLAEEDPGVVPGGPTRAARCSSVATIPASGSRTVTPGWSCARRTAPSGPSSPPRGAARAGAEPGRRRRDHARPHDPQGAGEPGGPHHGAAARPGVATADAGAALHGGDPRAALGVPRRFRGGGRGGCRPARAAGERAPGASLRDGLSPGLGALSRCCRCCRCSRRAGWR